MSLNSSSTLKSSSSSAPFFPGAFLAFDLGTSNSSKSGSQFSSSSTLSQSSTSSSSSKSSSSSSICFFDLEEVFFADSSASTLVFPEDFLSLSDLLAIVEKD